MDVVNPATSREEGTRSNQGRAWRAGANRYPLRVHALVRIFGIAASLDARPRQFDAPPDLSVGEIMRSVAETMLASGDARRPRTSRPWSRGYHAARPCEAPRYDDSDRPRQARRRGDLRPPRAGDGRSRAVLDRCPAGQPATRRCRSDAHGRSDEPPRELSSPGVAKRARRRRRRRGACRP